MTVVDLLILSLACWRVAFLVTNDHFPFGMLHEYLRGLPQGRFYGFRKTFLIWLRCIRCVSVAAAALVLVLWFTPLQPLVWIAAVSGGALMLHKYTGWDFVQSDPNH